MAENNKRIYTRAWFWLLILLVAFGAFYWYSERSWQSKLDAERGNAYKFNAVLASKDSLQSLLEATNRGFNATKHHLDSVLRRQKEGRKDIATKYQPQYEKLDNAADADLVAVFNREVSANRQYHLKRGY
jgi:hypothetical protein